MKKTTVKKKTDKVRDLPYKASIKVLGKVYESKGTTSKEAIEALKIVGVAKGISLLTVSNGEKSHTKILVGPLTNRLFSPSRMQREVGLKQVSLMFAGI